MKEESREPKGIKAEQVPIDITIIHPFKVITKITKVNNLTIPDSTSVIDVSDIRDVIVMGSGETLFLKDDVLYLMCHPGDGRNYVLCAKGFKEFQKRQIKNGGQVQD